MRQAIPFVCYALAVIKTAHYVINGEDADLAEKFDTYYRDNIHTNLMITFTVHPVYYAFRLYMKPFYKMQDLLLKEARENSLDNAVSFRVLVTFLSFMSTAMYFGIFTSVIFLNAGESAFDIFRSAVFYAMTASAIRYTMTILRYELRFFKWLEIEYNHYSAFVHASLLIFAAAIMLTPVRDALKISPVMLYTSVVLSAHITSYFFLRLAFAGYPRRHEKLASLTVHSLFAAGIVALSFTSGLKANRAVLQKMRSVGLDKIGVAMDTMGMIGGAAFASTALGVVSIVLSRTDLAKMVYSVM